MAAAARKSVALVTGCSSGVGASLAGKLAAAGWTVVATMRDPSKSPLAKAESLVVKALDVTDEGAVKRVVEETKREFGRVDLLVNNAGQGHVGFMETVPLAEARRVMEVNFFGPWSMTQAVLPIMREQGGGRIVTVTSVGGLLGFPANDAYVAAKHACEGAFESLACVASRFNIHVSLVEPGAIGTSFVANVSGREQLTSVPAYVPMVEAYMARTKQSFSAAQTPDEVADVIMTVVRAEKPSLRYQTSDTSRQIASLTLADPTGDKVIAFTSKMIG